MAIYFALIFIILLAPRGIQAIVKNERQAKKISLIISFFAILLVCVLRAHTVGRDILGYKTMYDSYARISTISQMDLYWTEPGYELLEMVCKHYLRLDWQVFMGIIYTYCMISYFLFIKRYSEDYSLSLLTYVCFSFFVFDLSAIRNMMGLATCLWAYPFIEKKNIKSFILFLLVVLVAVQFHLSAYMFLLIYVITVIPFNRLTSIFYLFAPIFIFAFRSSIMSFVIATFKEHSVDQGISLGGNAIFYLIVLLFGVYEWYLEQNGKPDRYSLHDRSLPTCASAAQNQQMMFNYPLKIFYFSSVMMIFVGENTLVRVAQYGLIFMIILLPNMVSRLQEKDRVLVKGIAISFLIFYFYYYKLRLNDLDILPYRFFWEVS